MADWHGSRMYLRTERGYNLAIRPNGEVLGLEEYHEDCQLEISSGGDISLVRIQGVTSQLYLCFDSHGNLYGEKDPTVAATIFKEGFQGSYSAYESNVYQEWYVGIAKNGNAKNGTRTKFGQKAVKFLPRRISIS